MSKMMMHTYAFAQRLRIDILRHGSLLIFCPQVWPMTILLHTLKEYKFKFSDAVMLSLLFTVPFDLLVQAANPDSAGNQAIIVSYLPIT